MNETQSDDNIYNAFNAIEEDSLEPDFNLDEYYLRIHKKRYSTKKAIPGPHNEHVVAFFSKPENFETMVKASRRIEEVTERIVKAFWDDVIEKLEIAFKVKDRRWKVEYSGMFNGLFCQVLVYHHTWCDAHLNRVIAIAAEGLPFGSHPIIGIAIGANNKVYDTVEIKKDINSIAHPPIYKIDDNDPFWSIHKPLDFSLEQYENIQNLLPEKRGDIVTSVVNEFVVLAEHIEKDVETILMRNFNS